MCRSRHIFQRGSFFSAPEQTKKKAGFSSGFLFKLKQMSDQKKGLKYRKSLFWDIPEKDIERGVGDLLI